jgi:hypothetical protein
LKFTSRQVENNQMKQDSILTAKPLNLLIWQKKRISNNVLSPIIKPDKNHI